MTRDRILVCTNAYPPNFVGGAELIAHYQAKKLIEMGYEVIVFAGEHNNNGARYSVRKDRYDGIDVYRVCLHDRDYSSDYFNFFHRQIEECFSEMLSTFSPQVVHFHNIIGLSASLTRIAKNRGVKTFLTLHDYWGICFKNTLLKPDGTICDGHSKCHDCNPHISDGEITDIPIRLRKDFVLSQLEFVDFFISPSAFVAKRYIEAGMVAEKIRVIPNGIDTKRFSHIKKTKSSTKLRISYIGYLGKHKGIDTVIESLAHLQNRDLVQINLIGDGEESVRYRDRVRELGVSDVVRFWGKIDNSRIEEVYSQTDVLLLPSIWPENQPVSITEAMAARIPIMASRLGGIPELVEDGVTGFLFEAGNAIDLAQKIDHCLQTRDSLAHMGERGFDKISVWSFENQMKHICNLYHSITLQERCQSKKIVLYIGKNLNKQYTNMIDMFYHGNNDEFRFLLMEWLHEEEIKLADYACVVDNGTNIEDCNAALKAGIPLLVPENSLSLKNLCIDNKCGLYFSDALEAAICLEYLNEHPAIKELLGLNSKQLLIGSLS